MFSTVVRALPPIAGKAAQASPVIFQRVMALRQSAPNTQRRDFSLIGSLIHLAVGRTSSFRLKRRCHCAHLSNVHFAPHDRHWVSPEHTIESSMRYYAQMIQNPELRRVTFSTSSSKMMIVDYLDFGERCIDKIISLKDYNMTYGDRLNQSNNRRYQERQDKNDRNQHY